MKVRYKKIISLTMAVILVITAVFFAIIKCESDFNANAKSSKGAMGLMQIIPSTASFIAEQLQIKDYNLFNAQQNINFGCFYLNYLFSKFNNERLVVLAYNGGEGRVLRYLKGEKLPIETQNYFKRVKGVKRVYKFLN